MDIILVLLGIFFAASGAYEIVESLSKLGKNKSDASIEIGWFKMNAPAGFMYGIIAIGIVIAVIKYHGSENQLSKIKKIENKLTEIQDLGLIKSKNMKVINLKIEGYRPVSIFDGKILWDYRFRDFWN